MYAQPTIINVHVDNEDQKRIEVSGDSGRIEVSGDGWDLFLIHIPTQLDKILGKYNDYHICLFVHGHMTPRFTLMGLMGLLQMESFRLSTQF